MESVASSLLALEEPDQRLLRAELVQIADDAQDEVYRKFVRSIPDMVGLASD
jgi:hypothetical protein